MAELVMLRCPTCKREMRVAKDKTDPKDAAIVQTVCMDCDEGGGFPEVLYFDKTGKQIFEFD